MYKRSSRSYLIVGLSRRIIVIKRRCIPKRYKIKVGLDRFFIRRLKLDFKCSVCRTHRTRTTCDCGLRYCKVSSQGSVPRFPPRRNRYRRRPRNRYRYRDFNRARYANTSRMNNEFDTENEFGMDNAFYNMSSDQTDYGNITEECWDADDYEDLEEEGNLNDSNGIEAEDKSDDDEKSNGSETSSTSETERKCICGRPDVGPSLHHCIHDDIDSEEEEEDEEEEEEEEGKLEYKRSDPFHPEGIDEWHITRKNSFYVGDVLKVHCLAWEGTEYCWVRLVENLSLYKRVESFLNDNQENRPVVEDPDPEKIYFTEHEGVLYRAKVISFDPETIRCIDTGVKFSPESMELRELDPEIADLEALAFQVVVSEESLPEEAACGLMKVEVIGIKSRGMYKIRIRGDIQPVGKGRDARYKVIRNVKSNRRNVLEDLEVGMCGLFISMDVQSKVMIGCLVPDEVEDAVISFRHVRSLWCMEEEEIDAEVGDFVMVCDKRFAGWRGIVKSKSREYGYEVNLVDMGFALYSKRVYKMPSLASDLLDLAARLKISAKTPGSFALTPESNYYFEIKEKLYGGKWLCSLKKDYESEEFPGEGILEKVRKHSHRIKPIPFYSGCTVIISALSQSGSDTIVFVRRVDGEYNQKFLRMCENVEKLPENTDKIFWNKVEAGDFVAAKYEDGSYYRAVVIYRNGKQVGVFFLDYGNEQFVDVKELKPLPYNMIEEPVYARRVTLSGPKDNMSSGGFVYLESLMKKSQELILHYTDNIADGVMLVDKEVHDINPELFGNLAAIQSKYVDKFTENFFEDCIYSLGLVRNFVVLHVDHEEFTESGYFWAVNPNNCKSNTRLQEASIGIREHCESISREYSPRNGELCFAFYEDDWYRGFATEAHGRDFEIFFVDYGNTSFLQSRSIRKMEREFFKYPPLAMKCVLEGFKKLKKSEVPVAYNYLRGKINDYVNLAEIVAVNETISVIQVPELLEVIYEASVGGY